MPAILTNATTAATANHSATTATQIIASGPFNGATVKITALANGQSAVVVHRFKKPGFFKLDCVTGTTLTATIEGGATPSITVTCNP